MQVRSYRKYRQALDMNLGLDPLTKEPYPRDNMIKDATLQDHKKVLETVRAIASESTEPLTPFEVNFLQEIARTALRFKENFRMTQKQVATLQELDDRILLPLRLQKREKAPENQEKDTPQ